MKIYIGESKQVSIPNHPCSMYHVDVCCHKICVNPKCKEYIVGYVYDSQRSKPIADARVLVRNKLYSEKCITDEKGRFQLYMPFRGTWCDVMISKRGYFKFKTEKICMKKNQLEFYLTPKTLCSIK